MSLRLIVIGAVALAGLAGSWWLGAEHVQAKWDASELASERGRAILASRVRRTMQEESMTRERDRAASRAQLEEALNGLDASMRTPVRCPSSGELEFGAVPVPGDVLDRLRRAGNLSPRS